MKKNNLIKIIEIFIFILLICINFTSSSCSKTFKLQIFKENIGNTLYVGGSGPNNYSTIQSAINDTNPGDTVFVYNDSSPYYKDLLITKSIVLKGEEKNTTIIDGSGKKEVIFISSNNIEIKGFSIINSSNNSSGIFVYKSSNYVIISGNIIKENGRGIFLYNPGYHMINPIGGILGPNENYIENNLLINNSIGISLHGSNKNIINRNWMGNNYYGIKITRDDYRTAPTSIGNRITNNVFIGNNKSALDECNNRWISNYWDDWIGLKYKIFRFLPYLIPGTFRLFVNLDWLPAKTPIEIV